MGQPTAYDALKNTHHFYDIQVKMYKLNLIVKKKHQKNSD